MKAGESSISLADALHIKSAELWLKLGQPLEALVELQGLTDRGRVHPWACKVLQQSCRAALGKRHPVFT